jgi:ABC-type metal ion transport system substrate-binding protein
LRQGCNPATPPSTAHWPRAAAQTIRVALLPGHAPRSAKIIRETKKFGLDAGLVEFTERGIPIQALTSKDIEINAFSTSHI